MHNSIKINKNELIVFFGSMNAMPMMYAWELKKLGYSVLYFVDAPASDKLSRPENHFPEIIYPYPDWIVELKIPSQMLLPYFARAFAWYLLSKIAARSDKKIACFVLNGFFISLSPQMAATADVVALSHGSDLDSWANRSSAGSLADAFCRRSIFKFLPTMLAKRLIKKAVDIQYQGFAAAKTVVYFPAGFNPAGDAVIDSLKKKGSNVLARYDVSFEPLQGVSREFKIAGEKLVIFSGVRFLYKSFPDGNDGYSKGNDIIIGGLAKYYRRNKNIEIHFVEKGEDVGAAKKLCTELGLDPVIVWHKEMPFKKMIDLYIKSDICFDQVGKHWMGAIGAYALYFGKPLIARVDNTIRLGIFPSDNPIYCVKTPEDIFLALIALENANQRAVVSHDSKIFVEACMSADKLLANLFGEI